MWRVSFMQKKTSPVCIIKLHFSLSIDISVNHLFLMSHVITENKEVNYLRSMLAKLFAGFGNILLFISVISFTLILNIVSLGRLVNASSVM